MQQEVTFRLLPRMAPTAPIYTQVSQNQRMRKDKLSRWAPNRQYTFADENGISRTARLKIPSRSIWQDEQIKDNIPANAKFTTREREAVKFVNGFLSTRDKTVIDYLKSIPKFSGFNGVSDEEPAYEIYDPSAEFKKENELARRQSQAVNKIWDMDLDAAAAALIRIHGAFFDVPKGEYALIEMQNKLVAECNSIEGVDKILQADNGSKEEQAMIMVGRLINAGVLSFVDVQNTVSKKHGNEWKKIMDISFQNDMQQRYDLFVDRLLSDNGKAIYEDLKEEERKLLAKPNKPDTSKEKK